MIALIVNRMKSGATTQASVVGSQKGIHTRRSKADSRIQVIATLSPKSVLGAPGDCVVHSLGRKRKSPESFRFLSQNLRWASFTPSLVGGDSEVVYLNPQTFHKKHGFGGNSPCLRLVLFGSNPRALKTLKNMALNQCIHM